MSMDGMALLAALAVAMLLGCNKENHDVTPSGATNLEGCPVPAGIQWADAEAIRCDQSVVRGPPLESAEAARTLLIPDEDVIDAALATEAEKSEGATEYREARKLTEGDLTGDGSSELVVLFTLEGVGGGNGADGFLAAFQRDSSGQLSAADTLPVAGYGGSAQDVRIEAGAALVKLLVQGPDDPACCPSEELERRYVLHQGRWLQVQP